MNINFNRKKIIIASFLLLSSNAIAICVEPTPTVETPEVQLPADGFSILPETPSVETPEIEYPADGFSILPETPSVETPEIEYPADGFSILPETPSLETPEIEYPVTRSVAVDDCNDTLVPPAELIVTGAYTWKVRAESAQASVGDIIEFNVAIKNAGFIELRDVFVESQNETNAGVSSTYIANIDILNVNATNTYSYEYTLLASDLNGTKQSIDSIVTVTGYQEYPNIHEKVVVSTTLSVNYNEVVEATCTDVKKWGDNSRKGTVGDVYTYANPRKLGDRYFKLAKVGSDSKYWYFPRLNKDNKWWDNLGTSLPTGYCPVK